MKILLQGIIDFGVPLFVVTGIIYFTTMTVLALLLTLGETQ